jgi:hypothetical protein
MVGLYCMDDVRCRELSGEDLSADLFTEITKLTPPMQTTANYIVSLMVVYEYGFPGDITMDNPKFRAFVWVVSEIFLVCAVALNFLPREFPLSITIS